MNPQRQRQITFPPILFSPDGKHFATVITTGQGWVAMIDGKVGPSYEALLDIS